jgi:putative transposase
MLTAQLSGRCSLRDVVGSLAIQSQKIYHMGIKALSRATLVRCNDNQPHALYEELFRRAANPWRQVQVEREDLSAGCLPA